LQVVTALLTVLFAVRAWRVRGLALRWSRAVRAGGALLRFSLPVHLASAIPAAVWLGVTAELARRWGMASLADLRVITMLNQIVGFIPAAIAQTFVTQFAAARGAEARVPVQDFMRYVRVIISGALVTALPVALIAPLLIPRLFGAAYAHTAPLVNLGLMTATVLTLKQAIMVALLSENRTVFALGDAVVSSLVCALVARWSIPALGVTGFVLAELLAHVTGALTLVLAMALRVRHAGVGRQAGAAAGLLLYVLAAMTAGYFTQNPAAHALLLTAALVVGIAGCACFVFDSHERGAALREVQRLLGAAKPYDG
jgi:O-antigen/teichoic acid export membrane protein